MDECCIDVDTCSVDVHIKQQPILTALTVQPQGASVFIVFVACWDSELVGSLKECCQLYAVIVEKSYQAFHAYVGACFFL
jgi:hypothetical protein